MAPTAADIVIGTRHVGVGRPVYFIAEAGSNHDRSLPQAHKLVDVAADSGADAVKFQTFRAENLYPKRAGQTDYLAVPRAIFDIIRDLEMPFEWIPELAAHCKDRGIDFLSTPFDEGAADVLEPYVDAFKIASYEMTHHGLVQHCAKKGKPLIVSTGTAHLDEVRELVAAVRAVAPAVPLVLMQCTARYPAPLEAINLRTIRTMADAFGVPTGLSDHSREPLPAPMAAVALGACVIEKHFTLSNSLPGPDHAYALEPPELADVIAKVRQVERALGDGVKRPHPLEEELRAFARRSLFTRTALARGDKLSVRTLAVLRAGKLPYGMHPREFLRVLGRPLVRDLEAEATLRPEDMGALVLDDGVVQLRPLAADDAERVVAWRSRADVHDQLFAAAPPTLAAHHAWFADYERRTERLEFVIVDGGTPVGTIGLSNIDFAKRSAEYGVLVGEPAARGRGVAARASKLLIDFAFDALDLVELELALFSDNSAALALYRRLGFELASSDGSALKDGRARAVTRMRLRRQAST